jgi:hypothetical protein
MVEIVPLFFFHAILYGVSWGTGRIAFSPLYERTLLFQPSARFRISDLMVLALDVQILLAAGVASVRHSDLRWTEVLSLYGEIFGLLAFWWLNGLRMLGRGGVNNTWHRWAFLGLLLPAGYTFGMMALISLFAIPFVLPSAIYHHNVDGIIWSLFSGVGWPGLYLVNRLSRRFVGQARSDRAENDGIHFIGEIAVTQVPAAAPPQQRTPYR